MEGLCVWIVFYTAHALARSLCTFITGMSDRVPVMVIDDPEPDLESFRCTICLIDVDSQDALNTHYLSVHHIMRSCKLFGLPVAMCVLCHSFALLSEEEHVRRPQHDIVRAAAFYPHFTGSPLRVIAHPTGMYSDAQRAQLFFDDEYQAVYAEHVQIHFDLFSVLQRAQIAARIAELTIDMPSPELSDSADDELQFFTP